MIFKNKKLRLITTLLFSFLICLSLLSLKNFLDEWASYDSLQTSITQTESLIQYINSYPSANTPPDNVPSDLRNEQCWKMLKPHIVNSDNEYQLSAFQNGNNPDPRALEDLIVDVSFSNNHIIKLHYFRGLLIGCQDN